MPGRQAADDPVVARLEDCTEEQLRVELRLWCQAIVNAKLHDKFGAWSDAEGNTGLIRIGRHTNEPLQRVPPMIYKQRKELEPAGLAAHRSGRRLSEF